MNNIDLLTEPSTTPCDARRRLPLVALVTSSPSRRQQRQTARETWAKHIPTYFLLGVKGPEEYMEKIKKEAKQYNDMIIYNYQDHYQNLTLKTALMLRWTHERCPHAEFLVKIDDDVLVNPWVFRRVIARNKNATLLGHVLKDSGLFRGKWHKWYLPRWLYENETVPQYLSGNSYAINGGYIKKILDAATEVPLINIEDIYFTYMVSVSKLGLVLTHEPHFCPWNKPTRKCKYWCFATSHSYNPQQIFDMWPTVVKFKAKTNCSILSCYD